MSARTNWFIGLLAADLTSLVGGMELGRAVLCHVDEAIQVRFLPCNNHTCEQARRVNWSWFESNDLSQIQVYPLHTENLTKSLQAVTLSFPIHHDIDRDLFQGTGEETCRYLGVLGGLRWV